MLFPGKAIADVLAPGWNDMTLGGSEPEPAEQEQAARPSGTEEPNWGVALLVLPTRLFFSC